MKLTLAYSPCPNDTFMFYGIACRRITMPGHSITVHMHDIASLNSMALKNTYDITKASFHAWLKVRDSYRLLNTGAALGNACGPLLVAPERRKIDRLESCTIAIPGELTTAYMLLRLWNPEITKVVSTTYDKIIDTVNSGKADAGLIIHESRFVYERSGLECIVDLGKWWDEVTDLPLPLGCIMASRSLPDAITDECETALKESITLATNNPELTFDYVNQHAQELDEDVRDKHIKAFVNPFSLGLGETGMKAVSMLETMAADKGII